MLPESGGVILFFFHVLATSNAATRVQATLDLHISPHKRAHELQQPVYLPLPTFGRHSIVFVLEVRIRTDRPERQRRLALVGVDEIRAAATAFYLPWATAAELPQHSGIWVVLLSADRLYSVAVCWRRVQKSSRAVHGERQTLWRTAVSARENGR